MSSSSSKDAPTGSTLGPQRIAAIHKLLKGLETGDPSAVDDVIGDVYIQHNPQTNTNKQGLKALFARLSQTNPRVNFVRSFYDGDYVFLHTEYDFATRRIGFEVFRFAPGSLLTVEHWDNIMPRLTDCNPANRSMIDGPCAAQEPEKTVPNKALIQEFVHKVFCQGQYSLLDHYVQAPISQLIQHNPHLPDGMEAWIDSLERDQIRYQKVHRVLGQGNFCLSVTEGTLAGVHTSFYDLWRVENGKVVEHWDTRETVAPKEEWKNENGKF